MNSKIAEYCFFNPVRILRGEPINKAFTFVRRCRVQAASAMAAEQLYLLQNQVKLAYSCIPFYRDLWNSLLAGHETIRDWRDFSQLPIIQKADIQNNRAGLVNSFVKRFDLRSTSGSTGTPLKFVKDRQATAFMDAIMYDAYSWHGISKSDRQARFWGMPHESKSRCLAQFKDFLMNRKRLSAFQLSEPAFKSYATLMQQWRPQYCYGYPSLMCEFAEFLQKTEVDLSFLRLKAAICTGEQLSDEQRELLAQQFHCPVVNEYGCTEVGVMGFECSEGCLHEMTPNIYLEVIKNGTPVINEEGDVVVTELHALTSPFIRYKTGDRGVKMSEHCSCGLPYPVIKILSGRVDDYILTPDGRKVYDAILAYTLKQGIKQFKAVQRNSRMLEIMIVPDQGLTQDVLDFYMSELMSQISSDMEFVFTKVARIPHEKSGKLRYFSSEMH
jgi:phenylacetate-CoA ligase